MVHQARSIERLSKLQREYRERKAKDPRYGDKLFSTKSFLTFINTHINNYLDLSTFL